jgi:hypothetical protein
MDRIVADPAIMGGVPCVRGTRIPVATIAGLLAEDVTVQDVLEHSVKGWRMRRASVSDRAKLIGRPTTRKFPAAWPPLMRTWMTISRSPSSLMAKPSG